jgi:hypothetical protein
MKELVIRHIPAQGRRSARARVRYLSEAGAQPQEREIRFHFSITDDESHLVQWYLGTYLSYPWSEFQTRAERVQRLMSELGQRLFDATFNDRETRALYNHVADDLPNTRIVVHASADNTEVIALPWELLRDPGRGDYGYLALLAHAFVRSQPDLVFPLAHPRTDDTFNVLMVICRPYGERGERDPAVPFGGPPSPGVVAPPS